MPSRTGDEIARAAYSAWNDGDLDAMLAVADESIVFRTSGAFPDLAPAYEGFDGLRRYWDEFHEPWERLEIEMEAVHDLGHMTVALLRFRATGRDGLAVDAPLANILEVRDGKVMSVTAYATHESALQAAGLAAG